MKVGSADNIRNIDAYCINSLGIPSIILMENAALKLLKHINLNKEGYFTIVCGRGNNGGDGLALGRHLHSLGKNIHIFMLGSKDMSVDCKINYDILKNLKIPIYEIYEEKHLEFFSESIKKSYMVIDGIFGTGLKREVEGIFREAIEIINNYSHYTLAIDIPSGLDSNTGKVLGSCVKATKTVSFVLYKRGFLNYNCKEFIGDVIIEEIGMPKEAVEKFHEGDFILEKKFIKEHMKKRDPYAHKGDFGRTLIIGGSKGFTGAPLIGTKAAVRTGAGLVTLGCFKEIQDIISTQLLESMSLNIEEEEKFIETIKKADSIAIGPGMGNNEKTLSVLKKVLKESKCPLVIDADGLNVLREHKYLLKEKHMDVILTPHVGEMATLTGLSIEQINENRIEICKKIALEYKVILVLKGYNTLITDGKHMFINSTGNSAMANGGMGDCLTGIIAALVGQGYKALEAAYLGVYIHGYCGDKVSQEKYTVNASHIINILPNCMKELSSESIEI